MAARDIHALFISYYYDMDRWHNDVDGEDGRSPRINVRADDFTRRARMMREGVQIDGRLYDLSRFLSWVRYGTTAEFERYDSYSLTLLAGSHYFSLLRRHDIDVHVANSVNRRTLAMLAEQYSPRFVLLSTTLILEHLILREAITKIRRMWPEAAIVLGGLFMVELQKTTSPEAFQQLLRDYGADAYVTSPQGETALLEILKTGSRAQLLASRSIPETYIASDDTVYAPFPGAEPSTEMGENYVRWNSVVPKEHLYHTVHTRTARSCAFKCSFCNFPVNQGPLTLMSPEVLDVELEEVKASGRIKSLIFTDDTFNVPLKRFKELCKVLAKYEFEWYSFFRAQYADDETAQLMKEAHCKAVFLGIESADDEVLENMHKAAKVETLKRGVEQLKKNGICTHANFIVGFPGDTEEKSRKLVEFLDEMEVDFFTVDPWVYVPSTPIHQQRRQFGLEGSWNTWKHNTMTSTEAYALTEQLIQEPKYSVPSAELAGNEFWGEIMLHSNGFTKDEVSLALRTFNAFRGKDTPEAEIQGSAPHRSLRSVLDRRPMPKPKNF